MFRPALVSFALLSSREKTTFLAIVLVRVFAHGLDVLGLGAVGLMGAMVAGGLNSAPDAEFLGLSVSIESSETYVWVVSAIAGFFVAKSVLAVFLIRATTVFLAGVEADASADLARYLYSADLHRLTSRSKGEVQWLVQVSTQQAFSVVLFAAATVVTELTLFLAIFAMFLAVDTPTALILVGFFAVVIALFQLLVSRRLRRLGKGTARFARNVNNAVLDLTEAYRELTVLEKKGWFLEKLNTNRRGLAKNKALEIFSLSIPRYLVESTLIVGILTLTVWQFAIGSEFSGLVVIGVFLAGGTRIMAALLPLQNAINQLRVTGPQAARAQDLLKMARSKAQEQIKNEERAPDRPFEEPPEELGRSAVEIRVDGVSYTYPDANTPALRNVNLTIGPGYFAALVGPSGAGKTTLADLILGLHDPTLGSIQLCGVPPAALRNRSPGLVSYVPQHPGMVSGSVAQNVALGIDLADIDEHRVKESLGLAGLLPAIDQMPGGIHSSLGEHSDALSGGQIQRLGIARALYSRPKLVVLDEATSALDAETEADIAETIEDLRGETTWIVIAHRLSTIQHADVVFVLEDGEVLAEGTFSEVRKIAPRIERYVQLMTIRD